MKCVVNHRKDCCRSIAQPRVVEVRGPGKSESEALTQTTLRRHSERGLWQEWVNVLGLGMCLELGTRRRPYGNSAQRHRLERSVSPKTAIEAIQGRNKAARAYIDPRQSQHLLAEDIRREDLRPDIAKERITSCQRRYYDLDVVWGSRDVMTPLA